jgi:hypothetical protein
MSRIAINRRMFLRGAAGITIALPFLSTLFSGRNAVAGPPKPPKRFVTWYTSTGTVIADWRPPTTGTAWKASPILSPLDTPNLRPYLTILSGIRMAAAEKLNGNAHNKGMTSMLTGRPFSDIQQTMFGDVGWGAGISLDQELAKRLAIPGQLKSIETGVIAFAGDPISSMSYSEGGGQANIVPSESDPRKVFTRLFANIPDSADAKAALEKAIAQRKSMIDLVQDDFKRLNGKLGKADQDRLDKHLSLIRDLEGRLDVGAYCAKPGAPAVTDGQIYDNDSIPMLGKLQMDLIAAGLACDVTRVATLQWSGAQSVFDFKKIIPSAPWDQLSCPAGVDTCTGGINTAEHTISHISVGTAGAGGIPASISPAQLTAMQCLSAISKWYSEQLAYFGEALRSHVEADGSTLLENTCVMTTTEVAEGPTHAFTDMPMMLLGGAQGALKPGHFDFYNNRSMNDVFVTVGQALDQKDFTTFGDPAYVQGPLTELLA